VTIGDGLTQSTKVVGHALHPTIVVTDVEVALLEDVAPGVELQNMRLMVAGDLSLECEPRLTCGLYRFPHDLVVFGGDGAEDSCHHDDVESNPIEGRIGDVREDVVVLGVATKREKHEVTSPLVVG
jgi:hypothetical protein